MSGGNAGVNFMEISKSSHSETRMEVDGPSLNNLMDFTTDQKIETKEWISNQEIAAAQQDELLCQDDMFSLAELSVVEDQAEQVIVETTICNETTTETVVYHDSGAVGDSEVKPEVPSLQSQPREEVMKNTTVEQSTPLSIEIEDTGKSQESENDHTAQIDARDVTQAKDASDICAGDKCQKESVQLNQLIRDNSQNVKDVSTTDLASTIQEDQPHLSQPETTAMKEEEEVINPKEPGFEDNSQCVENVPTKLAASKVSKDQPHLNQPEQERTELIWEQKQHDGALMKEEEENSHQRQHELETLNGEKEDTDQKQPEMETMKEEDKSEINDNKVSASDGQLPSTQFENMQSENVLQNTSTLASLESIPNLPQGGSPECNAEPMEHGNVEESESIILKEFESLKGRKVSKRFNKKKFLGEVIGYDPESQWFKVLYEDGDEEELEKEELDSILLPLGDAKASVSRKRHLSADDDEHEKPNRSVKKSRKLDIDGTPGKSRKDRTAEDQTPPSQRTSKAKKKESTVKKKSKSPQTNTPKTQTKRKKGSSTKKAVERKGSSKPSGTKSKNKRKSQKKQSVGKIIKDSAKQHSSVTKSLKFDSAKKKTPTKSKKLSHESPKKDKITRSGRTVRTPNKSLKTSSVDANKVEVQKVSITEKEGVHTPRQKRKLGTDIQDGLSAVHNKRAKKTKTINDLKIQSGNIVEDANLQISHENTFVPEFQGHMDEEKAEGSFSQSTGNSLGKTDRGTVLVGRKVKKDFGGALFGGEVVGYKVFYKVKYEDGDSEELTWKELESILLSDEGSLQNKNEEKQSVKSKTKQKKGPKRN